LEIIDKLLPLIGAFLGGVFTLIGIHISNKNNIIQLREKVQTEATQKKSEVLRDKLEELYTLQSKWSGNLVSHHCTYRKVMDDELSYNQALDLQIEADVKFDSQRFFTLAELYFPECHPELEKVKECRGILSDIQMSFRNHYKEVGCGCSKHSKEITKWLGYFNKSIDAYEKKLRSLSMSLI